MVQDIKDYVDVFSLELLSHVPIMLHKTEGGKTNSIFQTLKKMFDQKYCHETKKFHERERWVELQILFFTT